LYLDEGEIVTSFLYKNEKKWIPKLYAVYVFTPEKRRGDNGVMLTDYLGIGDWRDIAEDWVYVGLNEPIVMFPIAIPLSSEYHFYDVLSVS
jgi:hypothetical protein